MSQSSQTTPKRNTDATTIPLVILGASAFGEAASLLRDINAGRTVDAFRVVAILDDDTTTHGTTVHDAPVVGALERWVDFPDASFVFLIGSHRTRVVRRSILSRLGIPTERFVSLIHPAAVLFEGAQVGAGCLIYSGAVIFNDTILEDFVLVLPNSVVGAACTIAECALIASSVSIGSGVRIGPCSHIGAGAVINEGIELGAGSQVAMASFVVRPLPDGAFCMGNPAQSLTKIEIPRELSDLWRNHPSRSQTHGPS
jgi:sugar O-acyltransferase (sialic acid O-acetyltransferase NeuD family)